VRAASRFEHQDAWTPLLAGAAYIRANPRFDSEERDRKLAVADLVRHFLEAAGTGGDLRPHLDSLTAFLSEPSWPYQLALPVRHFDWIKQWADADYALLARTLSAFLGAGESPEARFAAFVRAAEDLYPKGVTEATPASVLVFGSLLNFALAPADLPVVRRRWSVNLYRLLGWEIADRGPIADRYENHLAFARELRRQLPGNLARDMLDVQDIVFLSEREEFWSSVAASENAAHRYIAGGARPDTYLAMCSSLGYEAPYLREWIEFHRLMGVERFFLYNNGDRQGQREVLAPYVEEGIVVLHDWPLFPPQLPAYEHCIEHYGDSSRWIVFLDADEFFFSPTGRPVSEMLAGYEGWPAVGVNIVHFMTSGHRTQQPGLVIENYTVATRHERTIKSIVNPLRVVTGSATAHNFRYDQGFAVDENEYPITGWQTIATSIARLRVNHYHTKSEEEFLEKRSTRQYADGGTPYPPLDLEALRQTEEIFGRHDQTIWRYLPALREVLGSSDGRPAKRVPAPG